MNKKRLKDLAAHIRTLPHYQKSPEWFKDLNPNDMLDGFNMAYVAAQTECGTAGCIAGHACRLFGVDDERLGGMNQAMELLGLENEEGYRLFDPPSFSYLPQDHAGGGGRCL